MQAALAPDWAASGSGPEEDGAAGAVTAALLWAFWECSGATVHVLPLRDGPTSLLGIFSTRLEPR